MHLIKLNVPIGTINYNIIIFYIKLYFILNRIYT